HSRIPPTQLVDRSGSTYTSDRPASRNYIPKSHQRSWWIVQAQPTRATGQLLEITFQNPPTGRSEEHTSELQSLTNLVCRLLLDSQSDHPAPHSFPTRRSSDLTFQNPTNAVGGSFRLNLHERPASF